MTMPAGGSALRVSMTIWAACWITVSLMLSTSGDGVMTAMSPWRSTRKDSLCGALVMMAHLLPLTGDVQGPDFGCTPRRRGRGLYYSFRGRVLSRAWPKVLAGREYRVPSTQYPVPGAGT